MGKTAYVVEGYIPNGGTYMAYHVARILHLDYHYDVRVVTANPDLAEPHGHGRFQYDPVFPCVPLADCERLICADDVLICNPSFSSLHLGLKVRGRKIMYAQGFTTFSLLDCFFDHYVAVSSFVRGFLSQTYGLNASVIPAFVPDNPRLSRKETGWDPVAAWEARPPHSMALNLKGNLNDQLLLLDRVRRELRAKDRVVPRVHDAGSQLRRRGLTGRVRRGGRHHTGDAGSFVRPAIGGWRRGNGFPIQLRGLSPVVVARTRAIACELSGGAAHWLCRQ